MHCKVVKDKKMIKNNNAQQLQHLAKPNSTRGGLHYTKKTQHANSSFTTSHLLHQITLNQQNNTIFPPNKRGTLILPKHPIFSF